MGNTWKYSDRISYESLNNATVEYVLSDTLRGEKRIGKFIFKGTEDPGAPMRLFIADVLWTDGANQGTSLHLEIDPARYQKIEVHPDSSVAQFSLT